MPLEENRSEKDRKSNKSSVPSHCEQPNLVLRERHSQSLNDSINSNNKKKNLINSISISKQFA